jgi:hypothetical protein
VIFCRLSSRFGAAGVRFHFGARGGCISVDAAKLSDPSSNGRTPNRHRALGRSGGGGNRAAGAAGRGVMDVIRAIAALALLTASSIPIAAVAASSAASTATDALSSSAPWWEKVVVTVSNDGKPRSCTFQSSLRPTIPEACEVDSSPTALGNGSGAKDQYTRITFERRFSPGATPEAAADRPGETFLGGQMMALAIDPAGSVKGCKVVATSGSMTPDYGCAEATAERFEASAGHTQAPAREGYMTILVYGHAEHVV